jgi:hypothetical protein
MAGDPTQTTKTPDLTTPEGMRSMIQIVMREEFDRFCDLQRQFLNQIKDDVLREELENALIRMMRHADAR